MKKIAIVFVLLLILVLVYVLTRPSVYTEPKSPGETDLGKLMASVDFEKVAEIHLQKGADEEVVLKKVKVKEWRVKSAWDYLSDIEDIDKLIDAFSDMTERGVADSILDPQHR